MNKLYIKCFFALLLSLPGISVADDIDLFVGAPPSVTAAPNVLIVIDNTANWNTVFPNEKAALVSVLGGLAADKFRVGVMFFTETGGGNSGNDGAYVRAALRLMSTTTKPIYQNLINSLDVGDDKSNGGKAAKSMEEAYLYFSAGTPHAGNNKNKADYLGNATQTAASNAIYALAGNALASKAATTYVSPIADSCAKNFVIYISNGPAQDNSSDIGQANTALTAAGGSITQIPISPSGSADNPADEWARFMKKSALGITTYTVETGTKGGQAGGWTALLKSMASQSGGKYFDVMADPSAANITNALNTIFSEIQSVNSVFASVSLPVSVNTQGTYLNQVYIGMFRPDPDSRPLWAGNLKQFKLGYPTGSTTLKLLDAASASAVNNNTGFIGECARSFWTPTTVDSYWSFKPQGDCLTVANSAASNTPDGNVVEKGAQAFMLRNASNVAGRTMKTCSLSSCTALTNFDNTTVTGSDLNPASALSNADRDALISWAQGKDTTDENINTVTTAEMRPSAHGDVVHSRPVAINHGTDTVGGRQVVVYYGGNDGVLHAINGNRPDTDNTNIGGKAPGQELWSFVPPEFYSKFKRLRDNAPLVAYPGQPSVTPAPQRKDYGMDGPVAAYKNGSTAYVYATMRRGGRNIYAFNVSTPSSPSLLWRRGCPNAANDTGCSTGFDGIGQTWSTPKVIKSADDPTRPMLLVGGGYDGCEDTDTGTANNSCSSPKGNKIYLMNAQTGAPLQTFTTERGVIADLVVVPDSSGLIKYAYAADLGGNIYRISGASATAPVGTTAPGSSSWTMTKIASLGCATTATCTANRKFMFAPSVIEDGSTYYILLGSGDREKPLLSYAAASAVSNYFFTIKDQPGNSGWLAGESTNCSSNVICLASLTPIARTAGNPAAATLAASKGWYLGLDTSEQVVTSAITVFDNVTFSTHQPKAPVSGQCSNLGDARVYNINYEDAAPKNLLRYENIAGDGLPPSPVAGLVTLDDGTTKPFCIGCSGDSPLEGGEPTPPTVAGQPKSRVFWNIEK